MIFKLVSDFADTLAAMPAEHPRHRLLSLFDEAIRRDVSFLGNHPTALFQCLWNSCWWYDSPQAAAHYSFPGTTANASIPKASDSASPSLSALLESWLANKTATTPGFVWLRSLRPPASALGDGRQLVFQVHKGPVLALAFSPDGHTILSADAKTVQRTDADSGFELESVTLKDAITAAHFLPEKNLVCTGTAEGTIQLFQVNPTQKGKKYTVGKAPVRRLALHPDGIHLAFSLGGTRSTHPNGFWLRGQPAPVKQLMALVNLQQMQVTTIPPEPGVCVGLGFSADGQRWLAALGRADGGFIALRDTQRGTPGDNLRPPNYSETYDRQTFELARPGLPTAGRSQQRVAPSYEGGQAVLSADGRLICWALCRRLWLLDSTRHESAELFVELDEVASCLAHSSVAAKVAVGLIDGRVVLVDERTGSITGQLGGQPSSLEVLTFSSDGRLLAGGCADGTVQVWRIERAGFPPRLPEHAIPRFKVTFAPDGSRVVTTSDDETIRLFDGITGTPLALIRTPRHVDHEITFSANGKWFVAVHHSTGQGWFYSEHGKAAGLYDASAGQVLRTFGEWSTMTKPQFAADGTKLSLEALPKTPRRRDQKWWDFVAELGLGELPPEPTKEPTGPQATGWFRAFWRLFQRVRSPEPEPDAIVQRDSHLPEASTQGAETVIQMPGSRVPIAWFPAAFETIIASPSGATWGAIAGTRFSLFRLEES